MKNLMLFIHPDKDFLEEHKTATKIQIDNSLSLGWKVEDIILATNFPYEYMGVKSLLVSSDNYCDFNATVTIFNVIVELFHRQLIQKDELYFYHDHDAFELYRITESELDLGEADIAFVDRGTKPKMDTGLIFFKSSTEDIFSWVRDIAYKYRVNEEYALMAAYTNNMLWITETESEAKQRFVPLNFPGLKDFSKRVKKLNQRYNFGVDSLDLIYKMAKKPIKVAHFHYSSDLLLDSAMYGKNSKNKPLMPKRLVKIFHKHGVKGIFPKKMKNLMIYLNPEKRFLGETQYLVKRQIDNSLELGWKKDDIILVTNFPYEYKGVKAMMTDDNLFTSINDKAKTTSVIFHLLDQGVIKEGELWWFHDLDVYQQKPIKSSEIDLASTTAGFIDSGNFFFRNGSQKLFEWIRNRAIRLNADEATALTSLAETNYRNINAIYKRLKLVKIFKHL